ncbi:MAG: hypothetical protein IJQ21_09710 [Lachnospiraceae bacterium]|nr:hypothetical protein [Lachnospiraceae bacterium]
MKNNRLYTYLALAALCGSLCACSGGDTQNTSPSAPAAQSETQTEGTADEPAIREEATETADTDVPVIESTDLTRFRFSFGDPEQTDPASGSGQTESALNTATWDLTLAASDITDTSSPVTCHMSYRLYTEPEDADFHTVSFDAEKADLDALQTLIAEQRLMTSYCNEDDEIDADHDHQYAHMSFEYASGESAWHYCNTACDIAAADRLAILSFFYDMLEKYNVRYYYHPVDFAEETEFVEAFLGQTAWDDLTVTGKEGEQTVLTLTSDASGRIFRLAAGDDVYAGNYKLKKREDDGRWRIDFTLTTWPAEYTPMTKGGSVLIGTEVGASAETLTISKHPNQASIFDPFYGEENTLVFTRTRSEYFNDQSFATEETG